MWNTSFLLPGVLLTPVTALAGPQVSLTVIATAGFAGSAAALFFVLRRHGASVTAAAIGGAIYGFSPALLHSAVGHFNLQFAVLPPLIVDAAAGLCTGARRPVRGGIVLGLLVAAQLFTGEELLADSAIAVVVMVLVLALARPRSVARRVGPAAAGVATAAVVTLILTGWALRVQLFGPLRQHGSAFLPDFYKNDLLGFIAPSNLELIHTRASAAFAASYQGGTPEYLAYLGVPLIAFAIVAVCRYWRELPVLVTGGTWLVLEVLSLGAHLLLNGHADAVALPWAFVAHLPVLVAVLPGLAVDPRRRSGCRPGRVRLRPDRPAVPEGRPRGGRDRRCRRTTATRARAAACRACRSPASRLDDRPDRPAPASRSPVAGGAGPDRAADRAAAVAGGQRRAGEPHRRLFPGTGLEWPRLH